MVGHATSHIGSFKSAGGIEIALSLWIKRIQQKYNDQVLRKLVSSHGVNVCEAGGHDRSSAACDDGERDGSSPGHLLLLNNLGNGFVHQQVGFAFLDTVLDSVCEWGNIVMSLTSE